MLGGAVAGLPTSAAAAASAAAVAVAAHKQFHPNSPPLDLDSWKEAFLQQANNNTNGNPNKNVRTINGLKFRYCEKTTNIWKNLHPFSNRHIMDTIYVSTILARYDPFWVYVYIR